jgi:hypothetical protein
MSEKRNPPAEISGRAMPPFVRLADYAAARDLMRLYHLHNKKRFAKYKIPLSCGSPGTIYVDFSESMA